MRRLLAAALLATAVLAPAASAAPPPCAYWVHGCNVVEYVYDVCDHFDIDCGIV